MNRRFLLTTTGAMAALAMLLSPSLAQASPTIQPVANTPNHHGGNGVHGGHDHSAVKDSLGPQDVLARDCANSQLPPHDGFEVAPACVSTAFGEVSAAANNPSLLIVDSPRKAHQGEGFSLKVSTRNLIRDRFLAAGQGGYYLETSLLNADGLQRGHYHVSCAVLANDNEAPVADRVPEFFKAIEDGGGSAQPDTVKIEVPGQDDNGNALFHKGDLVRCAAWAGDGSHRIPMMQRANETPAFDSVRFKVDH